MFTSTFDLNLSEVSIVEIIDVFVDFHSSGHADPMTLARVCTVVNPKKSIIPIHKEADTDFSMLPISEELRSKINK